MGNLWLMRCGVGSPDSCAKLRGCSRICLMGRNDNYVSGRQRTAERRIGEIGGDSQLKKMRSVRGVDKRHAFFIGALGEVVG
jgi:hypothetical protein